MIKEVERRIREHKKRKAEHTGLLGLALFVVVILFLIFVWDILRIFR